MTINKLTDVVKSSDELNKINEIIDNLNSGTAITVDTEISATSENPVQNKVISSALNTKQDILTAGAGISISGNIISVNNYSYSALSPALTPSNGVCTWSVTHNLDTTNVMCSLYVNNLEVEKNVQINNSNTITLTFNSAESLLAEACKVVVVANGASSSAHIDTTGYLAPNTVITVGTSGADFTTLEGAFEYIRGKWSPGTVTISIITDLIITDNITLYYNDTNFPQLIIEGNNHNITINFTEPNTYSCGFLVWMKIPIVVTRINFIGGTNGMTHVLTGGYYTKNLIYSECTTDNAYAGIIAYDCSLVSVTNCTLLSHTVGLQAQQGGHLTGKANTFGSSEKKCTNCYDVYHVGFLQDADANRVNYTSIGRQEIRKFLADGIILA